MSFSLRPARVPLGRKWTTFEHSVTKDQENMRLDRFLQSTFDVSRNMLMRLLRQRLVVLERGALTAMDASNPPSSSQVFRIPAGPGTKLLSGDLVSMSEIRLPLREPHQRAPLDAISSDSIRRLHEMVLYRDDRALIINKPAGMAVHSGPKTKIHLDLLLDALRFDADQAPRIVHRLDKDTSGVLCLGRTRQAAAELAAKFQEAQLHSHIQKSYWAMVYGQPKLKKGTICSNMYRVADEKMTSLARKRANVLDQGKVAITRYRVMGQYIRKQHQHPRRFKLSLVEFVPETGRKHQLRVHAAEQLGCPIVGDFKYGKCKPLKKPLHLHSYRITLFNWNGAGMHQSVMAPIPAHFLRTMNQFPLFLRSPPKFPKKKLKNQSGIATASYRPR